MNLKDINLSLDNLCDVINKLPAEFIKAKKQELNSEDRNKVDDIILQFGKMNIQEKEAYVNDLKNNL